MSETLLEIFNQTIGTLYTREYKKARNAEYRAVKANFRAEVERLVFERTGKTRQQRFEEAFDLVLKQRYPKKDGA